MQDDSKQMPASTSRAVRLESFGGPEVLNLREVPAPQVHGTDTVHAARELGVPDERITTIAAQVDGITPANGADATHAIDEVARLVAAGQLQVPIAASFPVEEIRAAVELQAARHVHGKVVITL
jgi:NADPH:quinone reductase-like Zn-dependent oxidoreductase